MKWYDPKDARRCFPEADYDAVVEKCEPHEAKSSGNHGRKLALRVYHGESSMVLTDYLMAGEKAAWKIKEFAKAIGQVEMFDTGEFDPMNFIGANVRVSLKIEDSSEYGEQNKIGKYLPPVAGAKPIAPRPAPPTPRPSAGKINTGHAPMTDDQIPFD